MSPALVPWLPRSLALLVAAASIVSASPYPKDDLHDLGMGYLMQRDCESHCGADNQLCCGSGERCMTLDGDIATCAGGGGGSHPYQTTTWTETRTFTSTLMTWWEPAPEPTAGVDCVPKNEQQEACGPICCAGWQTCAFDGQCSARPGYDEPSTIIITTDGTVTTQYSAPYRVTGTTTVVTTDTVTEGATMTTSTGESTATSEPIGAGGGGGGGLSGGAIAGIVIGSIAGAMLLLLLAFCCIARGLWKMCFGKKKKETTEVYEERYSRHGSRPPSMHSRRPNHSGWFGGGGGGGSAAGEKKSSGKRWLGLAGLAATLLALLNLRKEKKPARKGGGRSRYSDSYYSYSDYTSPSKLAST